MTKKESLDYLQFFIDKLESPSPKEIVRLRNLYDKHFTNNNNATYNFEFEFMPPIPQKQNNKNINSFYEYYSDFIYRSEGSE